MRIRPATRREAAGYIKARHRHHGPPQGFKFALAAEADTGIVGVVCVGRPVGRGLNDQLVAKVTRCCTDGTKNACSFLYGAAARVAKAMGYRELVTYTLASEPGASLRAAGFKFDGVVRGRSWSCQSRPRRDKAPIENKHRWRKILA